MNRFYKFHTIIRIMLIIATTLLEGWLFFEHEPAHILSYVVPFIILIQVINLINFQNRINEKINYFFEAIRNEDFSLDYPSHRGDKILRELHKNLTKVNLYMQQKKIEIEKQEQYFRALIEHINIGIITYNDGGFVLHSNKGFKKIFGIEQVTHLNKFKNIDENIYTTLSQIQNFEQKLVVFDSVHGQINLLIKASTFISQNDKLTLVSIQDIKQELDEKELDSWLKLIRVLTHEIMNSIAPVTSLTDSISQLYVTEKGPISPEEITEPMIKTTIRGLDVIKEQGRGLINFVQSFRQLTRLPKPIKKEINVLSFYEKLVMLNQVGTLSESVKIEIAPFDKSLQIIADEQLISQVLNNLIKNSNEALFNTANGIINLSAEISSDFHVELSVSDNGPGIAPDLMNEIFVPFFTTRENGNGIGLSLSRQIMRLHGGTLKAQSEPNVKTIFTMRF